MKRQLHENSQSNPGVYETTNWKQMPVNMLKGAVIGVGAILPGISGGVLCVVFGIYKPMMTFLSHPIQAFKTYYRLLLPVLIGWIIGFLGLARIIDILLGTSQAPAIWLFIGLIAGTFPAMFRTAGEKGRTVVSWLSFGICFLFFLSWMFLLSSNMSIQVEASLFWWLICGLFWGIGLIVPGLSPSAFLIFLGLYQPMTAGIADLSPSIIIPLIVGIVIVVLFLSRLVNRLLEQAHNLMFHALLGIVSASAIAIIPMDAPFAITDIVIYAGCFGIGFAGAMLMGKLARRTGM